MAKTNWYALYTKPRTEKKVHERLQAMKVESYLPLHRTPCVWSDRVKMVDKPLFPSYLFVRCREPELRPLLNVFGVVRIVYYCGQPAVIPSKEITAIRAFLEQAANHELYVGEEVEILSGALKRISGKIRKIKKKYLMLYIEQIGATVCVDLSNVMHINHIK